MFLGSSERATARLGRRRFLTCFHMSNHLAVKQEKTDLPGTEAGFQKMWCETTKKNISYKVEIMSLIRITNRLAVIAK